jgi:hypothetical protein
MPASGAQSLLVDQGRQPARKAAAPANPGLSPFQIQTVSLFVRAAEAFSLPRSAGQVYGLLFSTPQPLNLDEMTTLLHASRGGTWEGLDWLRQMGAVIATTAGCPPVRILGGAALAGRRCRRP